MGYLIKMDHTGHSNVINWGGDAKSRAEAQQKFDELAQRGGAFFAMQGDQQGEKLKSFDPEQEGIIYVPQLRGG